MEKRKRRAKTIWSEAQDSYLREHYPTGTIGDIADYLDLSPGTVSKRAKELGLSRAAGWSKSQFYGRYVGKYNNGGFKPRNVA